MAQISPTSSIVDYCNSVDKNIIPLLKQTGAVISGSTCVYFLLKELGIEPKFELENADIDIFITAYQNGYKICKWFNKNCITTQTNINDKKESGYMTLAKTTYIDKVMQGYIKNTKIDLIHLSDEFWNPNQFINKYFDLDFCKNTFDGEKFDIYDIDSVKNMECSLKYNYVSFNKDIAILSFGEYEKAIVTNDLAYDDRLHYISRINKYRKRGFKINVNLDFKFQHGLDIIDLAKFEEHIKTTKRKRALEDSLCMFITDEFVITNVIKFDSLENCNKNNRAICDKDFIDSKLPYLERLQKAKYNISCNRFSFNNETRFIKTTYDLFLNKTNDGVKYIALLALHITGDQVYLFANEVKQC